MLLLRLLTKSLFLFHELIDSRQNLAVFHAASLGRSQRPPNLALVNQGQNNVIKQMDSIFLSLNAVPGQPERGQCPDQPGASSGLASSEGLSGPGDDVGEITLGCRR